MDKARPFRARHVSLIGPLLVQLHPKDFAQLVTSKPLTIIRGVVGVFHKEYVYIAADGAIAYCTRTKDMLSSVQVDIVTNSMTAPPILSAA